KSAKDLDQLLGSQITDNSKKGLGYSAIPLPHPLIYNRPNKLDLSYSGLDEFKEPEMGPISDDEDEVETTVVVKKKTVIHTAAKIEKPVWKPVKYAEMYSIPVNTRDMLMIKNRLNQCGTTQRGWIITIQQE
ncbi:hypothetical protein Tco_0049125, partial [Tanacetum coccineum]